MEKIPPAAWPWALTEGEESHLGGHFKEHSYLRISTRCSVPEGHQEGRGPQKLGVHAGCGHGLLGRGEGGRCLHNPIS